MFIEQPSSVSASDLINCHPKTVNNPYIGENDEATKCKRNEFDGEGCFSSAKSSSVFNVLLRSSQQSFDKAELN